MLYGWFNITIDPIDEEIETPDTGTEQSTA
jgi:hypothetical protein